MKDLTEHLDPNIIRDSGKIPTRRSDPPLGRDESHRKLWGRGLVWLQSHSPDYYQVYISVVGHTSHKIWPFASR